MRNHRKRLDKVHEGIQAMPVTPAAAEAALARFRETGQLPEHRLAKRMIEHTLRQPRPKTIREMLFHEALSGLPVVQAAARSALELLGSMGQDVASRNFVDEDMAMPDFGSVGLHLLGWPECVVKAPYEEEATHLLDRLAELRLRVRGDRRWSYDRFGEAIQGFRNGAFPSDDLMRDAVLMITEFLVLLRHLAGGDIGDAMAGFDAVARATDHNREAAERQLVTALHETHW